MTPKELGRLFPIRLEDYNKEAYTNAKSGFIELYNQLAQHSIGYKDMKE